MNPFFFDVAVNTYVKSSSAEVLFSGCSQTKPAHRCGPQILDYYLIHMVMQGSGRFETRGKTYSLKKGDSFFIYPGELVTYEADTDQPWMYRWVALNGAEVEQLLEEAGLTRERPIAHIADEQQALTLFENIQKTLAEEGPEMRLQAGGFAQLLLAMYAVACVKPETKSLQTPTTTVDQVEKAIRWLSLQYAQNVSIDQLAHSLGYHRTYLAKIFKEVTGLSPMQYLLKLRLDKAKNLLKGPLSVGQVASSVGFNDPLYFSRQFKKAIGMPPTEYQQQQRADRSDLSCY